MLLIRKRAFARAGLVGNPSDGYHGRTISISVRNFWAEVVLYEWDSVDIVLLEDDRASFRSVKDLARDVRLHGYYGGIRLVKATIKRFVEYCEARHIPLHERNFSIRYETTIPRQVGLAGSSAIIVATLRCLMEFYGVTIPLAAQPTFVLSVEKEELSIAAGLQDRVIQVHEGLVSMDFGVEQERMVDGFKSYAYERLDPGLLPPLYLAYSDHLSEPTEVFHNDIRGRFDRGEKEVITAMRDAADLALCARQALKEGRSEELPAMIDANFDIRRRIYKLPSWQVEMVETARRAGASANFAGSGGAVIGTYDGSPQMLATLRAAFQAIGCNTIEPTNP
jgi:galactokinase/mevalonate kinase-like predicted kinase